MRELYPIGTQLITRRLSQAALYVELFGEEDIEFYKNPGYTPDEDEEYKFWVFFCLIDYFEKARVIVTEENQKWLSPVPIVGDLVDVDQRYSVPTTIYVSKYDVGLLNNPKAVVKRIIERTYPNGQKAPLIEWDEVILPEQKG